ncbi:MAG: S-layer family protein [Calothrix sp. MO_192.B10]|nr:S-layer family protein [Calothrix sp. MO_192.B10]
MKPLCRYLFYLTFPLATLVTVSSVRAQSITEDTTLGNENSQVIRDVLIRGILSDRIDGGATRGKNLFHSFSEFNINEGRGAYFSNPAGIENIISRVTGSNASNILGTLGILGNANLFFANPNGIIFGPNARLDVSGSFFASTSDSFTFDNGFEFSASNPQAPPLLTVNMPVGLRFRDNPGSITNQSVVVDANNNNPSGLLFTSGILSDTTLALVGGEVFNNGGRITAPGARVEIGGLAAEGIVGINNDFSLSFPEGVARADVSFNDDARVDVRGIDKGSIIVNARNLNVLRGSSLIAGIFPGFGSPEAQAGDIVINATDSVVFGGINNSQFPSGAFSAVGVQFNDAEPLTDGNAGDISIVTGSLILFDGAQISASTFGRGNAGNIRVTVDDSINIASSSSINSSIGIGGLGNGGDINILGKSLTLTDDSQINSSTFGKGNAGNISVRVTDSINLANNSFISSFVGAGGEGNGGNINLTGRSLTLTDNSQINSSTFGKGNAGNISVRVTDSINLANNSFISSFVGAGGEGFGGDINLTGRSLTLTNGSQIGAFVFRQFNNQPGGIGTAGNIDINMTDFINISGAADTGFSSGLFASAARGSTATESKAAGDITVTTGDFRLSDGAVIRASTANAGDGGQITINANNFAATNGGQISTTTSNSGNAGSIKLNISDRITISGIDPNFSQRLEQLRQSGQQLENVDINIGINGPQSGIFANTTEASTGDGGSISIDPKTVEILDSAIISAESRGIGNPGSIDIQVDELLLLRRGAKISTLSAQDNDNISNIKINTGILVAFPKENSDISANAGGVEIFAQGIFGIVRRDFLTDFSDITARAEIDINNPEVDPIPGLVELPETVIDPDSQIAQNPCQQGIGSTFTATGRGGLPPNPTQDLSSGAVRVSLATPVISKTTATNTTASQPKSTPTKKKLVPAQGWVFNSKGQIVLTAYDPNQIGVQRTAHKGLCRAK